LIKLKQGKDAEAQADFDAALKIDPSSKTGLEEAINKIKQARASTPKP
jgi:Tfp pilus assembly protein PilF